MGADVAAAAGCGGADWRSRGRAGGGAMGGGDGGLVGGLCVLLPGGARMEVADAGQVVLAAELLRALAGGLSREAQGSCRAGASC